MQFRDLGKNGLRIAPIVLGGNVFGWTIDEKQSFAVLDAFVDAGFNCIDTADMYSNWVPGNQGGESERIIGNWMASRKNRDRIVLASKVGMEFQGKKGLSRGHIEASIEGSLKRLQTDYLDLYQAHADDASTPLEETVEAFEAIRKSGKSRSIGASNYSGERLNEALITASKRGFQPYETLQPAYNLFDRKDFESGSEGVCVANSVSVITYYSLASGFLSGKYRRPEDFGKSPRGQGVQDKYFNERGTAILKALDEVSEDAKATPAQVALAWLLHKPVVTAPIVSATSVAQLSEILRAARLELTRSQMAKLDLASAW